MKILVTGATGNVGCKVIQYLKGSSCDVIAAVRDPVHSRELFPDYVSMRQFDFLDPGTFLIAFQDIDILFLLRPPQLSRVNDIFKPLLEQARNTGIRKVVFLSVQGADTSRFIPHNKIERLIRTMEFQYLFVRPGYFMQNLTTTLLPELLAERSVTLPAGEAEFNWIDIENIGEAVAIFLTSFEKYKNQAYDLTGQEKLSFPQVIGIMREITGIDFTYKNIDPIRFYIKKKREGMLSGFILVMIMLHFLPRFQKVPPLSDTFFRLTDKAPITLHEFISRESGKFCNKAQNRKIS